MLRELARDFAAEEIRPHAAEWDRSGEYPLEAIRKAFDLGLHSIKIPEEYGGGGMGSFEEVLVSEELGWGDPGFATASSTGTSAAFASVAAFAARGTISWG